MSRVVEPPQRYWSQFAAYGAWLLVGAVAVGGIAVALIATKPGVAPAAVVGGALGIVPSIFLPSRAGRRANNPLTWDQLEPELRVRWQRVYEQRTPTKVTIVLVPPIVGIVGMALFGAWRLPWPPVSTGDQVAAVIASALALGAMTAGLQWLAAAWAASREC